MCHGRHDVADLVEEHGFNRLCGIVNAFGGDLGADEEMLKKDLCAAIRANELRVFTVQAYTSRVHATWALAIERGRYVLLSSTPACSSPDLPHEVRWRVVMFCRHLNTPPDRECPQCAATDLRRRWGLASFVEGPERKSGIVRCTPHGGRSGIVWSGPADHPTRVVLMPREARSYAHCREHTSHPAGMPREPEQRCAYLARDELITYVPMWRMDVPAVVEDATLALPIALLAARETPATRPHPAGIGLTPIPATLV